MTAAAPAVVQRPTSRNEQHNQLYAQRHHSEFKRLFSFKYRYVRACVFVCVCARARARARARELECVCTECTRKAVEAVVFQDPNKNQANSRVLYEAELPFQTGQHYVRRNFKRFSLKYRKSESTYVGD